MGSQINDVASKSLKVLHLDDDQLQLDMMETFFKEYGYPIKLVSVSNPIAALNLIDNTYFDCIVTDFRMPELNGLEFARQVRNKSNVPIILYTGQGSEEVAEKAFSIGINDYIRKEDEPSHYQILAKRIVETVDHMNSEMLNLKVVEDARDAICITDGVQVLYANRSQATILGLKDNSEIIGTTFLNWIDSEEQTMLFSVFDSLFSGGEPVNPIELHLKKKDGAKLTVEATFTAIDFRGKKVILSFIRDISDRKIILEEKTKSEDRFRTLMDLAPDGIATISLLGVFTFVNQSFCKLTGFSYQEIVGKHIINLPTMQGIDPIGSAQTFLNFLRGKVLHPIEFRFKRKTGEFGWGEAHLSLINGENGKKEVITILRDITERKNMEDELRNYSKNLEAIVEERTKKLTESERMAVAGNVSAMVIHDLRGPLNTIRNAAYVLEKHPDRTHEMIASIQNSIDRAITLLEETRNQIGERVTQKEEVEFAHLIRKTIEETPFPTRIKVNFDLDESIIVNVDQFTFRRVIENIIRNAVEAISGKGKISVLLSEENGSAKLEVMDTGIGIPDSIAENLFKPLMTTKKTGTGLGLHYCKKVIDENKGSITLKSEINKGTTVTITLPLKKSLLGVFTGR